MQVQSLVGELRSHKPHGSARNKERERERIHYQYLASLVINAMQIEIKIKAVFKWQEKDSCFPLLFLDMNQIAQKKTRNRNISIGLNLGV